MVKIRISIKGTPEELLDFCKKKGIDLQIITQDLPSTLKIEGQDQKDDPKKIEKAFRKMSWETIYLAHLISANAPPGQQDELGYYLTLDQIEKFDISERQVASRIGGAKRLCKRLSINYILFSKKRRDGFGKNYYLSTKFIPILENFLQNSDFEYREYLDDCESEYPH